MATKDTIGLMCVPVATGFVHTGYTHRHVLQRKDKGNLVQLMWYRSNRDSAAEAYQDGSLKEELERVMLE